MMVREGRAPVRKQAQKPKSYQAASLPAPTRGWIANGNLAAPEPGGAAVLENWFPTAQGAVLRRGSELYATLGDASLPVTALFSYKNGNQEELFGATASAVYDITTILTPVNYSVVTEDGDTIEADDGSTFGENSTIGLEVLENQTGGAWNVVQFATSGGVFLDLVNGTDDKVIYNGSTWYPINDQSLNALNYDAETVAFTAGQVLTGGTSGATATIVKVIDDGTTGTLWLGDITGGPFQDNEAITDALGGAALANGANTLLFGAFSGVATADLSFNWAYKNRLFYIEKESLSAWYLPVDSLTGAATELPLGGIFGRGGSLLFGASWSLDAGSGLSAQCVFVTTEGEVAVYQGSNPGDPADWALVGVYRIGRPLGSKAFIRAGGDLVIATDIGFVPLSQAIQRDYAALSPSAVSYPIEDAWNEAVALRSSEDWHCEVWPSSQMVMVAPPTVADTDPEVYVANSRTGAWAKFTGWDATCLEVFQGRLFFGSADGKVVEANVTGLDQESTYTGNYVPLFSDLGHRGLKTAAMARAVLRGKVAVRDQLSVQSEYQINLPSAPDAALVPVGSTWGGAVWGESTWGAASNIQTFQNLRSVYGSGYALAPALQITSGSTVPLDTEIVRTDLTFTVGEIMV